MHKIPDDILAQFDAVLIKGRFLLPATQITRSGSCTILISEASISLPDSKSDHVRLFIEKLRTKNQTLEQ